MRVHDALKIRQCGDEALRSLGSVAWSSVAVHLLPDGREARRECFVLSHQPLDDCGEPRLDTE